MDKYTTFLLNVKGRFAGLFEKIPVQFGDCYRL
jgi:hypothetical protein